MATRSAFLGLFSLSFCLAVAKKPVLDAWNGHTDAGSTTPKWFTPYHVAPGTKSYDSASPLVHYTGNWAETHSRSYVDGSIQTTFDPNAEITFSFDGTGIEWFGNVGPTHGTAYVFIDGKQVGTVDAYRPTDMPKKQQRVWWRFGLTPGKHVLKIRNARKSTSNHPFSLIDLDAFVVTQRPPELDAAPVEKKKARAQPPGQNLMAAPNGPSWSLVQKGSTGVHAMQLVVISETHALVVDKVEHNLVDVDHHPAWAALYNLDTHAVKPLRVQSNSFCAGGSFLGNGTLLNVGGNPVVEDHTSAADFGDLNGMQAIRLFHPCDSHSAHDCAIYEHHSRIRMASPRWYNSVMRLDDGSAMIIGGSKRGGWINNATDNNPTYEFWPPKNVHGSNGLPIHLQFLVDTLNSNLFPISFLLPDGRIFMAANNDAMIYDWKTNNERRLPSLPNGVRVTYPMAGTGLLLPLTPENNYQCEVLLCGGSAVDDHRASYELSSQDPASNQCVRMVLTEEGIARGWEVEQMPEARIMPDAVLLPSGDIIIVNGGATGVSGYGNVKDQVGQSNADHPTLTPVLYRPTAPAGQRFSSEIMPKSDIPRLYHSVATLTPSGMVMIAGSNPNLDRSELRYGTEYRVEWLSPPYMGVERPKVFKMPKKVRYGKQLNIKVDWVKGGKDAKVVLMDLGYVTHAVHANSRMVVLKTRVDKDMVYATGPPNARVYPPGPAFVFVVEDGVPTRGIKVMVGDGEDPPLDTEAWENLLKESKVDQ